MFREFLKEIDDFVDVTSPRLIPDNVHLPNIFKMLTKTQFQSLGKHKDISFCSCT